MYEYEGEDRIDDAQYQQIADAFPISGQMFAARISDDVSSRWQRCLYE